MPNDVIRPTAFNPGPSLARVAAIPDGWSIDCRDPRAIQTHNFTCESCTAEFAQALRDEGGWSLRFGPGCDAVAGAVDGVHAAGRASFEVALYSLCGINPTGGRFLSGEPVSSQH